jgi:hypothetical protein
MPESPAQAGINFTSSFFAETKVYPVSDLDVHWISKPRGVSWKEYRNNNTFCDWDSLLLVIQGAKPSTSILTMEIVFNVEIVPDLGSITGAIARPGLPHSPKALTAASHVHSRIPHAVKREGLRLLENLAVAGLSSVANFFAPGSGAVVHGAHAMIRDVVPIEVD